jgi:hypothetical protein
MKRIRPRIQRLRSRHWFWTSFIVALGGCSTSPSTGSADATTVDSSDARVVDASVLTTEDSATNDSAVEDAWHANLDAAPGLDAPAGDSTSTDSGNEAHDAGPCTGTLFDERTATVLRGIESQGGYFHLGDFRSTATSSEAVTIDFLQGYAECAGAPMPDSCEEWVFSSFSSNTYGASGWTLDARDHHGHRLEFSLIFNAQPGCNRFAYARLDGVDVVITSQSYTTGTPNTCGITTEPVFSSPASGCH